MEPIRKECPICGKLVLERRNIYCSAECRNQSYKSTYNEKNKKAKKGKKARSLDEISKQAREAGMTYGQYVAMVESGAAYNG